MEHDLQQLSPYGFQQMCAALALEVFGTHVEVLGPGRDGGRDLYFRGSLTSKAEGDNLAWAGYTVFQIKQKQTIDAKPESNASWLWAQIRGELEAWANRATGRDEVPENLIFMTNVALTPTPKSGGHDVIMRNIKDWVDQLRDSSRDIDKRAIRVREARVRRMSKLRHCTVWDGNKIDALLSAHSGVRRQFKAFLTPGDILANLDGIAGRVPLEGLPSTLRTHARTTLTGDAFVYFDEAGAVGGAATPLEEVVIDLPITSTGSDRHWALAYTLDRGDRVLTSKASMKVGPRHLVIAGAPGNGKTTLSKFIVQAYRAAFLAGDDGLSEGQQRILKNTTSALRRLKADLPQHRRWPMRIDLAEYAEHALDADSTLLKWIASKVSSRVNAGTVTAGAMQWWMGEWPWLLVLDGLDEVTTPDVRKRLIRQVVEFVEEADGDQRDLLVVLTTRPVGYVENISPELFERIDLAELDTQEAIRYGMLATRVRLGEDEEKIQRVQRELQRAAEDDALRPLMRTPLQVLIMTIIVDGAGSLSPDRYSLFWGYYDTIRRRELGKAGPTRKLLETHGPVILELHQRVGFELQVASEQARNSTAVLSREDLRRIAREVLILEGWGVREIDSRWLDEIEQAVTQRLVLLAPRGDDGYGFDVRSLQGAHGRSLRRRRQGGKGPLPANSRRCQPALA